MPKLFLCNFLLFLCIIFDEIKLHNQKQTLHAGLTPTIEVLVYYDVEFKNNIQDIYSQARNLEYEDENKRWLHCKSFGDDHQPYECSPLIQYMKKFLSAVSFRFQNVFSKDIAFHMHGALEIRHKLVKEGRIAEDNFDQSSPKKKDARVIYLDKTLEAMGQLRRTKDSRFPNAEIDISLFMTGKEVLCLSSLCNLDSPFTYLGASIIAGVCSRGATIVQDLGGFSGVQTAVKNIGHLLGAELDGCNNKCSSDSGYIMSDNYATWKRRQNRNNFKWSKCSINSINKFIEGVHSTCLYNKPNGITLKGDGGLFSREELVISAIPNQKDQCSHRAKTKQYNGDGVTVCGRDSCQNLMCDVKPSKCLSSGNAKDIYPIEFCDTMGPDRHTYSIQLKKEQYAPAMEGTRCPLSSDKTGSSFLGVCQNGECKKDSSWTSFLAANLGSGRVSHIGSGSIANTGNCQNIYRVTPRLLALRGHNTPQTQAETEDIPSCLDLCKAQFGWTACEYDVDKKRCTVHYHDVFYGNGKKNRYCYIIQNPNVLWRRDGRCGPLFPLIGQGNQPSQCNPTSNPILTIDVPLNPCCSKDGFCGNTDTHCLCKECINYGHGFCSPGWTVQDRNCLKYFQGPKLSNLNRNIDAYCKENGIPGGTSGVHKYLGRKISSKTSKHRDRIVENKWKNAFKTVVPKGKKQLLIGFTGFKPVQSWCAEIDKKKKIKETKCDDKKFGFLCADTSHERAINSVTIKTGDYFNSHGDPPAKIQLRICDFLGICCQTNPFSLEFYNKTATIDYIHGDEVLGECNQFILVGSVYVEIDYYGKQQYWHVTFLEVVFDNTGREMVKCDVKYWMDHSKPEWKSVDMTKDPKGDIDYIVIPFVWKLRTNCRDFIRNPLD